MSRGSVLPTRGPMDVWLVTQALSHSITVDGGLAVDGRLIGV